MVLSLSFAAGTTHAQCGSLGAPSTTWTDGSGDWSIPGNWNGGSPTASTNACIIDGTSTVTLSGGGSVASLQLAGGNGLVVSNGSSLTVTGTNILNAGTISLGSTGSFTDLILNTGGGTLTLSGGGTVNLSNSPNNRVFSFDAGADTVINDVGHTIQGAGQFGINNAGFGFALTNKGIIDANQSNALQVAPSGLVTNTGTLEATSGGTLNLIGTFNNVGGTILGTGASSVVELSGSAINNGTLTTASGGTIQNSATATVNGVTISGGSTLSLVNGSSTALTGTITNNGTIAQNSTGSFTDLRLSGAVTLTGTGSLTMSNSVNNRVFASGSDSLTNDVNHVIQGSGQLGINNAGFAFTLTNNGVIDANQSTPLQVAPTNTVTNNNLLEATNGGTLELIGAFNNAGGTILGTGSSSVVELNGSTINNGTLTTAGGGAVQNSGTATLDGVTISSGSTFTAINSSSTTLQNTITINPTGTLALSSTGSFTDLHISGTVELAGGGTLAMSNSPNNRIFATGTDTLINDAGNTIQGAGQLGINNAGFAFTLTNKGTINANQSGGVLQVAPTNTVTNTNVMEATNGGTLALVGAFTNTGGTILGSGASSVVEINGSTITGGTLTTNSGGAIQNSGTATLDGVTISSSSTFTAVNASSTTLLNTITINPTATLALSSTGSFTDLHISGTVELAGGGTLAMSNSPNNRIFATGADTLINDAGNTIQGAGQLGINNSGFAFTLINNGVIDANQSATALQVAPTTTVMNNNLLEASNGGTLVLTGGAFNNAGTILGTGAGSVVELNGSTINGGTLTTASGGTIQNSGTATLNGVTISGGSTFTAVNSSSTTLMGTITDNGTIAQNSTGSFTDLHISGVVTLTGTGSLTLSNSPNNRIFATGTDTLINAVNHTIQGSGQLGINNGGFAFTLINNGVINANQNAAALEVAPSATVMNNNLLEASNGGNLLLTGGAFNNAGTILGTGAGSVVELNGSTINGGTLTTNSGGIIQNSGTATLNGVTISGGSTFTAVNSSSTTLMGAITDNGTIAQNSTGSFTDLHISGAVTLTGTGSLTLSDSPNNRVFATGLDTLTNDVNHTIQGGGQLGINNSGFAFALTNNGTIIANQTNPLQVAPGSVINNGTMQVILGSTMQVLSPFTQNAGKTQVDGTMLVSSGETVTGGTVLGTGTISGNISMTGGVMQPGGASTPGALVINGNYDSNAAFNELISGSGNGLLIVNGSSTLDSGAVLNIDLLGGFTPFNGETFILMDYFSGSGTFANAPTTGFQMDGFNWTIAYNLTDIVLDAGSPIGTPTPEPGTLVLLAIGLAGLSRQIRARGK